MKPFMDGRLRPDVKGQLLQGSYYYYYYYYSYYYYYYYYYYN